jgi:hypothetical protein
MEFSREKEDLLTNGAGTRAIHKKKMNCDFCITPYT